MFVIPKLQKIVCFDGFYETYEKLIASGESYQKFKEDSMFSEMYHDL